MANGFKVVTEDDDNEEQTGARERPPTQRFTATSTPSFAPVGRDGADVLLVQATSSHGEPVHLAIEMTEEQIQRLVQGVKPV